jgi:hypothetical protein
VIRLLARLAAFAPERFAQDYLVKCILHLLAVLKHTSEHTAHCSQLNTGSMHVSAEQLNLARQSNLEHTHVWHSNLEHMHALAAQPLLHCPACSRLSCHVCARQCS